MKKRIKEKIGKFTIKLGEKSVGKCMIPGMYDPVIPKELRFSKDNTSFERR